MSQFVIETAAVRGIFAVAILAALSACGGGGGPTDAPSNVQNVLAPSSVAAATLAAPTSDRLFWHMDTPSQIVLRDGKGVVVPANLTTCSAVDSTQVEVSADCSHIKALRLGALGINVSGNGASAQLTITGVPQRQWSGAQGDASSQGSGSYAMVTQSNGQLLVWGGNPFGVLGQNKSNLVLGFLAAPTPVLNAAGTGPLSQIMQASAGNTAALALSADGEVWAWGYNNGYALGRKDILNSAALPVSVMDLTYHAPLTHVAQIGAGADTAVALMDDGTVVAWGDWPGDGDTTAVNSSSLPVQVVRPDGKDKLRDIVAVSGGHSFSLALGADGRVYAWGFDLNEGRLGSGKVLSTPLRTPIVVKKADGTDLSNIVQISAGYDFSMALAADGTVWAWGDNSYGQLGQGVQQYSGVPYAVQVKSTTTGAGPLSSISMVAAGGTHALALGTDGTVYAWGTGTSGQLGDGPSRPTGNGISLPRAVVNLAVGGSAKGVVSIAAGYQNSLVLLANGDVLSWGDNFSSALGRSTGTALSDPSPGQVLGAKGVGVLNLGPVANYPNLLNRAR